jgi:hypothetical protein
MLIDVYSGSPLFEQRHQLVILIAREPQHEGRCDAGDAQVRASARQKSNAACTQSIGAGKDASTAKKHPRGPASPCCDSPRGCRHAGRTWPFGGGGGLQFFSRFRTSFIVKVLADLSPSSSSHDSGTATGAPERARTP